MEKKSKLFITLPEKKSRWIRRGNFKLFLREIKWGVQRLKYGYSDCDSWNIDSWFLDTIVPLLKQFRQNMHSYPAELTYEEWEKIIDNMISFFTEGNEETSKKQENDFNSWREYDEYINKNLTCGLDLFKKYFWNLWD